VPCTSCAANMEVAAMPFSNTCSLACLLPESLHTMPLPFQEPTANEGALWAPHVALGAPRRASNQAADAVPRRVLSDA
jgi:hypothetical protein